MLDAHLYHGWRIRTAYGRGWTATVDFPHPSNSIARFEADSEDDAILKAVQFIDEREELLGRPEARELWVRA